MPRTKIASGMMALVQCGVSARFARTLSWALPVQGAEEGRSEVKYQCRSRTCQFALAPAEPQPQALAVPVACASDWPPLTP